MKKCWCGNEELEPYGNQYRVCNSCHTLVSEKDYSKEIYNVKDEKSDLYGSNYWTEHMIKISGLHSLNEVVDLYLRERTLYWLSYIVKYILPGSNIIEVGCGLGQFSYLIKLAGFKQLAFELSPEICSFASETLGINIRCGDVRLDKNKADAIVAYDFIEHISDPVDMLRNFSEKTGAEGFLNLQTPCYDENLTYEDMCKIKPRFVSQMKAMEHVYLYSKHSIKELLGNCGFENIQFEPAFFGDDYDMFLFASQKPLKAYSEEEIEEALNHRVNGRLIKALLKLFNEKQELERLVREIGLNRDGILADQKNLIAMLNEIQTQANLRLQDVIKLNAIAAEQRTEIERLRQNSNVLQEQADLRLKDVIKLNAIAADQRAEIERLQHQE